ncbi:RHS repeat-associated core domain-containing protein [Dyella tabacisoli]|nr:RHS repeat-associated core domain-containing protein [Dyella tabacisoli]
MAALLLIFLCLNVWSTRAEAQACVQDGGTAVCTMAKQLPPRYTTPGTLSSCQGNRDAAPAPYDTSYTFTSEAAAAQFMLHSLECASSPCAPGSVYPMKPFIPTTYSAIPGYNPQYACRGSGGLSNFECNGYAYVQHYTDTSGVCQSQVNTVDYRMGKEEPIVCPVGYSRVDGATGVCKKDAPQPCPCLTVGHPIQPGGGAKLFVETDYTPGIGPLTFSRNYNSHGYEAPVGAVSIAATNGILGRLWRTPYDSHLYAIAGSTYVTHSMVRADGSTKYFRPDGSEFPHFAGTPVETLVPQADGSWTFTSGTDLVETYDAQGRLTSLWDKAGALRTLSYDSNNRLQSVTDARGRSLNFTYQIADDLTQVVLMTTPAGESYVYTLDRLSNLLSVDYPGGKTRRYVYENANLINAITGVFDENGSRYETVTYDGAGHATSSFLAPDIANGTIELNRFGYYYDWSMDVTDPLGKTRTFSFSTINGVQNLTAVSAPCVSCGATMQSKNYDSAGYPANATDFNGSTTLYTYDDTRGLETQRVEASNDTATPSAKRTIQTAWHPQFRLPSERRTFNASNTLITKMDWVYNARGQVLARCEVDPAMAGAYTCATSGTPPTGVRRWTTTYCDTIDSTQCPIVGLVLSTAGPRTDVSDVTNYRYYLSTDESGCGTAGGACHRAGDLYQVTEALGQVTTTVAYDKNGRILRQRDTNGVITDLTYHPRGWLLTRTVRANADGSASAQDAMTQMAYDGVGNVTKVTDPDGVFTSYTYDPAHRLTDITDALGNRIHYTLDAAGNKTKEDTYDSTGTVRHTLSRSYNTLGQLTAVVDALNRTVFNAGYSDSYDANGNLVHTADALGVQRKQGYDGLSRLVSTLDNYNGTDTATQNTSSVFAYDARDNLQGISDPDGLNTTYNYDGLSNATALQSPDTGNTSYTYDAAGNRISQTDAKGVTGAFAYDALSRLIAVSYADTTLNISYSYDEPDTATGCSGSRSVGHLTRVVEGAVSTVFCYDARGNLTQKSQIQSGQTDATLYTYTLGNRLSSVTSPSHTATQYTRDAVGRINAVTVLPPGVTGAQVGSAVSAISYLPFGPIAGYTLGNGQAITRNYDANYQLTDLTSPVLSLHFARDAMGNITALGNVAGANPSTETYQYDPLYRVTAVNGPSGAAIEAYTYSKTGDRLSKIGSGQATGVYSYVSGTHRLSSTGSAARAYDANGNTTGSAIGGETFGFGYNGRNRMSVVQRNGQTVGTYAYNAFGQRISKIATLPQAVVQRYVYDENSHLIGEYGNTNRDYIWLNDLPVAVVDMAGTTSAINYVHADDMGTPRAVTDSAGTTLWQWSYAGNPFGEQQPTSVSGYVFNLRFPGQYHDAESGLKNNRYRYFESARGGYSQSDPVGLGGGLNTYTYGYANPLGNIDPSGLWPIGGARVPSAHSPPPGPGGNYGRGVPSLPLPEVPVGPEQTPGAWPNLVRPSLDTVRCVKAMCLTDPMACRENQLTMVKLKFIGLPPGMFPTAANFKRDNPFCKCNQWKTDAQIMAFVTSDSDAGPDASPLDAAELAARMWENRARAAEAEPVL